MINNSITAYFQLPIPMVIMNFQELINENMRSKKKYMQISAYFSCYGPFKMFSYVEQCEFYMQIYNNEIWSNNGHFCTLLFWKTIMFEIKKKSIPKAYMQKIFQGN